MVELEKREFKEMWDKAWRKEWGGLNHHDCFLHGLLIEELVAMGVMGVHPLLLPLPSVHTTEGEWAADRASC